jgi:hypothetical protein
VHNTLLDVFQLYRTDRNALTSTLSADMKGMLGSTTFTPEEMKRLGPKLAALDTIIDGMVQRSLADSTEAWAILGRLQDALNKEFGLKLRLERKPFTHQPKPPA